MLTPSCPKVQYLNQVGHALREELRQLEAAPDGSRRLASLLTILDEYEAAMLAIVTPAPAWQLNPNPTPAELRAEREASPIYQLGWVRGYARGQAVGQQRAEPTIQAYARHAPLPAPVDPSALIRQVRCFLEQLHRRAIGAVLAVADLPPLNHAA